MSEAIFFLEWAMPAIDFTTRSKKSRAYLFVRFSVVLAVSVSSQAGLAFADETIEKDLDTNLKGKYSHLKTTCNYQGRSFELNLGDSHKKPDDESKEFGYPYFWIKRAPRADLLAFPPRQFNEFLFLKPSTASICRDTLALPDKNGRVAIFFRQNNRPFPDQLGVTYYDPYENRILAFQKELGISKQVEKAKEGFNFLSDDSPTDIGEYSLMVHKKEVQPSEHMFQYWSNLQLIDGALDIAYERDLTWNRSPEKAYFETQAQFESAIGYNPKTQKVEAVWVFTIKNPDCVQFSVERKPHEGDQDWFCKK